ncbi:M20 family metallopeptidase [Senegalia massiliensis]|uniref:M20 family metallopeptidase n=1 Tax=Senegalia massiliensis TaxID=1720316 RepID=UPI001031900E|nr:ArgE/DapE family deacylase [Senegalia massiliensis]
MDEKLLETFEKNKREYLHSLKKLVSIDTQLLGHGILGGKEKEGQEYIEEIFKSLNADEIFKEPMKEETIEQAYREHNEGNLGHNYEDRYNVVAKFNGKSKGKSILFNGHIDTMPPGELSKWKENPHSPYEKEGKLYGLGTADMKSGLMASIMAVKLIKDAGYEIPVDITITSVVDEEGGGNGSIAAIMNGHKADTAIVCEPSENNIIAAHMGFVFFEVKVKGVALHSGYKWNGVNAIEKAIKLIRALNDMEHKWLMKYKHPLLPPPTLNIGVIEGGTAGSTVPDECTFKLCLHYLPKVMNYDQVVKEVTETINLRAKGDDWLQDNMPEISIYQAGGAFEVDLEDEFVKLAKRSMEQVVGDIQLLGGAAGNDARLFSNILEVPTIIMGPGYAKQCHSPNEYVNIEDYFNFIKIYANLILNMNKE